MQKFKKILLNTIKFLFSAILIAWMINSGKIDLNSFKVVMHPKYLLLTMALLGIALFFGSERWRLLLKHQNLTCDSLETFKLTLIGVFFTFAIPGGVGGDLIKSFYIAKNNPQARIKSVLSVLMDRVLGLYAMLWMAEIAMLIDLKQVEALPQLKAIYYFLSLGLFAMTVGLGIAFSKKINGANKIQKVINYLPKSEKFLQVYESVHSYGDDYSTLAKTFFLSLASQISSVGILVIVGFAMNLDIPISTYFIAVPIGMVVLAIPISPGGVGVGQYAFYYLFNLISGQQTQVGSTGITVFQILSFFYGVIGAYFYISRKEKVHLDQAKA